MRLAIPATAAGRAALVAVTLVAAFLADLAVGASWPGRIAVFGLAASAVLVIGAKFVLAPLVARPAGTRVGELGNPADDLEVDRA